MRTLTFVLDGEAGFVFGGVTVAREIQLEEMRDVSMSESTIRVLSTGKAQQQ
jgi:hypothetical protein